MGDGKIRITIDSVVPESPDADSAIAPSPWCGANTTFEFQANMPEPRCIDGTMGGSYPSPEEHEEMMWRRFANALDAEMSHAHGDDTHRHVYSCHYCLCRDRWIPRWEPGTCPGCGGDLTYDGVAVRDDEVGRR